MIKKLREFQARAAEGNVTVLQQVREHIEARQLVTRNSLIVDMGRELKKVVRLEEPVSELVGKNELSLPA